jgi:hypothetical protein
MERINRRQFFQISSASALMIGCIGSKKQQDIYNHIPAKIVGQNSSLGHKILLGERTVPPSKIVEKDCVIIGAGITGLSTAYTLKKNNFENFTLIELGDRVGGNASYGSNATTSYPFGAHYVTLPPKEAHEVRSLYESLKIIKDYNKKGEPFYEEEYLCFDPSERLFLHGSWQEGLLPQKTALPSDKEEYSRFFEIMQSFQSFKDSEGKRAFTIPVSASSLDTALLQLDTMTMLEWLKMNRFQSKYLFWYLNYCCRDDFGSELDSTSAWAGIHYFASRHSTAANTSKSTVLTWPEGNGWLVRQLTQPIEDHIHLNTAALSVTQNEKYIHIICYDAARNVSILYKTPSLLLTVPQSIVKKLIPERASAVTTHPVQSSPWVVANISVESLPQGKGFPLSWDNVVYDSPLLGYVVATHQHLSRMSQKTVLTYYWPLTEKDPSSSRKRLRAFSSDDLKKIFLDELISLHPELLYKITGVDLWIWGHAMVRPEVGVMTTALQANEQTPPIMIAHTDMSGISIFEEGYTRGVNSAKRILKYLK